MRIQFFCQKQRESDSYLRRRTKYSSEKSRFYVSWFLNIQRKIMILWLHVANKVYMSVQIILFSTKFWVGTCQLSMFRHYITIWNLKSADSTESEPRVVSNNQCTHWCIYIRIRILLYKQFMWIMNAFLFLCYASDKRVQKKIFKITYRLNEWMTLRQSIDSFPLILQSAIIINTFFQFLF